MLPPHVGRVLLALVSGLLERGLAVLGLGEGGVGAVDVALQKQRKCRLCCAVCCMLVLLLSRFVSLTRRVELSRSAHIASTHGETRGVFSKIQ